ncbi:MAG: ECF-type sigma factor [Phycisphaerae bacterium]
MNGSHDQEVPTGSSSGADMQKQNQPVPGLYDEMRSLAARYLHRQRADHTLQPTALVHEAYMRLIKAKMVDGIDAKEMICLAASAMRSVLVDHARRKSARKRKLDGQRVPLELGNVVYADDPLETIALDEALSELSKIEPQWITIIELRYYGGCTEEEIAEMLGLSSRTVRRHWRMAKAWLKTQIEGGSAANDS